MSDMNDEEIRQSKRFSVALHASIMAGDDEFDVQIVSFSTGGCAIRTTSRLSTGRQCTIDVPLADTSRYQELQLDSQVIWGKDDYRIDTFYLYGLRFDKQLSEEQLHAVLKEEHLSAENAALHPATHKHKSHEGAA